MKDGPRIRCPLLVAGGCWDWFYSKTNGFSIIGSCERLLRLLKPMVVQHVRLLGLQNQCYLHMFGCWVYNNINALLILVRTDIVTHNALLILCWPDTLKTNAWSNKALKESKRGLNRVFNPNEAEMSPKSQLFRVLLQGCNHKTTWSVHKNW